MLPSTGYFKTINCPFYDNGSCDRPYCHFKHARRDTGSTVGVVEAQTAGQAQENKPADVVASNSNMLQHLVTEAVKKVLADQEVTNTEKVSQNIVSQVVEGLKPTLVSGSATSVRNATPNIGKHIAIPPAVTRPVACVYNPTPIAELKKRHIPVISYMPTRESRVAVKRKPSPERAKLWLNDIQESSSSQQPEVTYKPTAIVNSTDQDAIQNYVPTVKSDLLLSNSYEDSNSNDYQSKFKEEYYPRSKKRREEYVPKKIKTPLKTVQQLNDTTLNSFEPEFNVIDEILTTGRTAPNVLEHVKASASEDSQDYSLEMESKFSDDESIEDISKDEDKESVKKAEQIEDVNEKEKENLQHTRPDTVDKQMSNKDKIYNNHYDAKTGDTQTNDRSKQHKANYASKSSDKKEESMKENTDKDKERRKDHNKSKEKNRKDYHSSSKNKERCKHRSDSRDSRDRHGSSSSRNKDKIRSSRDGKNSLRSKEHSDSRKHRRASPKKDRNNHHKSSRHDKHKSTSNSSSSKSNKHTSSKSNRKHHSESTRRSSDSSRKSSKYKESSSEKNSSDRSDNSEDGYHSFLNDEILELSDSDHDVQEECLKIFQEYQASDYPKLVSVKKSLKQETEDVEEVGKKRVAHSSAATTVTRQLGPSQPPKKLITPQQKMYERWRLMKEAAAVKAAEKATADMKTQVTIASAVQFASNLHKEHTESTLSMSSGDQSNTNVMHIAGRIRIAHVPYAKSLAMEKKKVTVTIGKSGDDKEMNNKTIAQTTKGGMRVAHVPQTIPHLVRPEPLQVATQKFPLNVRQYYINMMHDICVQIYTSGDDAAQRAVKEEFACHERCKALAVYKNSCMLAAHRLRKEVDQSTTDEKSAGSSFGMVSHEAMLAGKSKGSWSIVKTKRNVINLKGSALYNMLKKWILTETQLRDNGFPRKHPNGTKGQAKVYVINARNQSILSKVPNERICSRCGQAYMVDKQSFPILQQNCIYHWGRKFTIRGEGKYSCCQQYGSATGCCDAKTHVWDYTDYENLRGYVKTLSKDVPIDEQGVYALDCEMCYTTQGLELTRVTVIDEDCNVIYETLVKPQNSIIDYNTRFSGITEEDMKDVTTTMLDVQATLLTMFSSKTILVGHSLESDFKALKLLHDTVVDTSVMFPHKNGYPQKRALKNLCSEYLRKIIQNDVGGHDSKEDAVACMELVQWKVKEEAKLQ
ncbi:RNA exonuclease 1 homolog isoform X2 [Linepithema humile]|uniref:RNA exonuclease 1 homolog isoform X2 n=1 Tax=Linepithema humile TaxID=83485 RepID=UPI0006235DAB|nr:PREDICTED: RNA exonuclease 1 homolog isoform X2 [Linepithema humile]